MKIFVVISGCSGGGKSTLLAELARRGFATIEEPGRRIVRDEIAKGGGSTPWNAPEGFARRAIGLALDDLNRAETLAAEIVFFDRGLVDAATAFEHATGELVSASLKLSSRYHRTVFFTPPWPELFSNDAERRHSFDHAVAEHERLIAAYQRLGYGICYLPKSGVAERADFVVDALNN
ncbi:MAG: AAA family ATPase [Parvularculaceae bacterium]